MSSNAPSKAVFPSTRYQGSKRKLLGWIGECLKPLAFDSCLDLFSGTASVSYLFKQMGKRVTSNDLLQFNQVIAEALIVNEGTRLPEDKATLLWRKEPRRNYSNFIASSFDGLFYLREENEWLDIVIQNIHRMPSTGERQLALFALYQACLAKRPFNLFHRANLNLRTADVKRKFGNKTTWDAPFSRLFLRALDDANRAVFRSEREHIALCQDCFEVPAGHDLVYLDPPYLNSKASGVNYLDFYHFLEGLTVYDTWPQRMDSRYRHRPFFRHKSPWQNAQACSEALGRLFDIHRHSILVVSYRGDGTPSVEELLALFSRHGRRGVAVRSRGHQYALSRVKAQELLLISEP